jgi:hypothetical protein
LIVIPGSAAVGIVGIADIAEIMGMVAPPGQSQAGMPGYAGRCAPFYLFRPKEHDAFTLLLMAHPQVHVEGSRRRSGSMLTKPRADVHIVFC